MPAALKALALQAALLSSGAILAELTGLSALYSALYAASFLVPAWMLAADDARVHELGFGAAYFAVWLTARPVVGCAASGEAAACVAGQVYDAFGPRMAMVTYPQFFEGFANAIDFLLNALPYVMGKTFQAAFGVNWGTVALNIVGTFLLHGTVAVVTMESARRLASAR